MLLKFMTMNTEDENRDEIEAQEVGKLGLLPKHIVILNKSSGGPNDSKTGRRHYNGRDCCHS